METDDLKDMYKRVSAVQPLSEEERADVEKFIAQPTGQGLANKLSAEEEENQKAIKNEGDSKDIRALLAEMGMGDKIKAAMFGNSTCRGLLILDTNRLIQQFVLKNPKLREPEVEAFAKNPNISENVLRSIADRKEWMKSGAIRYLVVTNPRTPPDISLKWLRFLNQTELKKIAKSKNLPQIIAVAAKKRFADMEKK